VDPGADADGQVSKQWPEPQRFPQVLDDFGTEFRAHENK
jgi:hypothetical protein